MVNIRALGVWDPGSNPGILICIGLWCNAANISGFGPDAQSSNLCNPTLRVISPYDN